MSTDRKVGLIRFAGDQPMELLESTDSATSASWSTEEEALSREIGKAIKRYFEATATLLSGKYQHLKDIVPAYLSNPGSVFMAICNDGIVIRYEKRTDAEPKKIVGVMRQSITGAAAQLSQNLVHIATPDAPLPPSETFGTEMKFQILNPSEGTTHDLSVSRIWFQVPLGLPREPKQLGAKPYCLLSVRNQLEVELHGIMGGDGKALDDGRPFITRSAIRLVAGWECIEVFPELDLDDWNPNFAPLWAERDILGAALVAQTIGAQLANLDPRASARQQYAELLGKFKDLLDSNPDREQVLQSFLQQNPILLCPTHVRMWPKLPLGATVTDFVFRDANQDYILVELERSTLPLFRQDGHATADLTHAHGQIIDWKRYLEDNLATVQRELGLDGITPNPSGLLVIGRSQSLTPKDRRKLQTMASESPKLRVMTYDDVYESTKAVFENLLGPIWDTGGSTQVFYPQTCAD